jgi:lipopolysaccharide export LptBFGC system permease protein LptF
MNIQMIPQIFLVMLPLVGLFALPLASPLAVQMIAGSLIVKDEGLFLLFVRRARFALYQATLLFTLATVALYVPLVFFWAPASYSNGKELIIGYAYDQLQHLEARTVHSFLPGVSVYFEKKSTTQEPTIFDNILLMLSPREHERYFFSAQCGELLKNHLILQRGSLVCGRQQDYYTARFSRATLDLVQLFNVDGKTQNSEAKFQDLPQLIDNFSSDQSTRTELFKRLAQLLWQLLLPFIALFLTLAYYRQRKNTVLLGIVTSGLLFFAQYASLALAQAVHQQPVLSLMIFFLPPIIFFLFSFFRFRA